MIYNNIAQLVGKTPLFRPENLEKKHSVYGRIYCKLEYLNPAGSIKDRAALSMINDAEKKGLLKEDTVIIEPTSGNTGIGLAAISAPRGYRVVLTMPETMSEERRLLLSAYGAEIVLTDGDKGMAGAVEKAKEIADSTASSFVPDQFGNFANAEAHYETTAPEIYNDLCGKVDMVIAGVGTGGTITGIARFFKEKNCKTEIIAVEPSSSPLLSKGISGAHGLQGIGANFIPSLLDTSLIDRVVTVSEDEAFSAARDLAKNEGLLTGITSGAALSVALSLASAKENKGKNIVCILPDTGDRYLSTPLYK